MSRLDLGRLSSISPATVTNVVAELLEEGIILETGLEESEGGRPRMILAINPNYGYFVGVDLGETHVQLELFNLRLQNQQTVRYLVAPEENLPEKYVEHIAAGLKELIAQSGVKPEAILGVGIGVPGVVERNEGVSVLAPMWKWQSVPFWDLLKAQIDFPLYLDNGAKAMTLAESWFGAGRSVQDLAVVLIGTGIGAGIITQGSLYRGATNSAGEWGHTKIVLDGRPCRCGSQGCLEAYAGAPGIIATLHAQAPDSPLLAADNQLAVLNNLTAALEQHDPAALQTLESTAHYLGAGIANLINLFNPELVLIGGWVGLQIGKAMMDDLNRVVERYVLPPLHNAVRLNLCELGQDAICMGAACLVLEGFLAGDRSGRKKS
jgi:glucokinase-like ROK family protein